MLHKLTEGMCQCKLDQINADLKGYQYGLARYNIDQQIVHGSECKMKLD